MTLRSVFVATWACFLVVSLSMAQAPCSDLMKFGIYDEFNTLSSQNNFKLFQSWLCTSQFSSYQQAKTAAASLGMGVDAFSLNFGGTTAESNWSQWSSQMCQAQFSAV